MEKNLIHFRCHCRIFVIENGTETRMTKNESGNGIGIYGNSKTNKYGREYSGNGWERKSYWDDTLRRFIINHASRNVTHRLDLTQFAHAPGLHACTRNTNHNQGRREQWGAPPAAHEVAPLHHYTCVLELEVVMGQVSSQPKKTLKYFSSKLYRIRARLF